MRGDDHYQLTTSDLSRLNGYKLVVDAIGQVFGDGCECVLHSLADLEHSVIHIHNGGKTGRVGGSPVTDKALTLLKHCEEAHQDVTPVYLTQSRDGHPMRSTTLIIRNDARRPIGFLCINFDLGTPLIAFLDAMMKIPGAEGSPARPIAAGMCRAGGETFVQNVDELLTSAVARIQQQVYADAAVPARSRTRAIVEALDQEGFFKLRNAVPHIAAALSISSDAVYMHLRALKRRRAAEG